MSAVGNIDAVHLYPSTMNTYGDRGNVASLSRRAAARGIDLVWHAVELGDDPPERCDLVFMGGGQDRIQHAVADDLRRIQPWLAAAADDQAVVFAVCAGLQLLGHRYVAADGSELAGVGLLDLETVAAKPGEWRLIGNVVAEVDDDADVRGAVRASGTTTAAGRPPTPGRRLLAGFENHGGRTWLDGDVRPLGRVRIGFGNNGVDGGEGARRGTVLATYLHGPVLPKNAWLTDELLGLANAHAGGEPLTPLPHEREDAAQAEAVARAESDAAEDAAGRRLLRNPVSRLRRSLR